jgi:MFS family permease
VFLLPMTFGVLLIGLVAGRLERRFGARALLTAGNLVNVACFVLLTFFREGALEVYTASALLGVGTGIAMAALATLIVSNVGQQETGAAAGVNNVARMLGGAVGAQISAALLAAGAVASGLHDAHGYTLAFAVGLIGIVVATLLGPLLPGRLEEPTGSAALPPRTAPGLAYRR